MWRKIFIGLGAVVAFFIAAVVAIPFFISENDIVDRLTAEIRAATGRDLTIGGDIGFSVFPTAALTVDDVAFADADWADRPAMAEAARVSIGVAVLPLLSGDIQIERFVIDRPVVTLEMAADGRRNWTFETGGDGRPAAAGDAPESGSGAGAGDPAGFLADLSLGEVALNDGRLTYIDRAAGTEETVDALTLALSLPGLDAPFALTGGATWRGEALALALETGAPRGLLDGARTAAKIAIDGAPFVFAQDGGLTLGDAPSMDGAVSLEIPSLRRLVAWAAAPLPDDLAPGALERVAIQGDLVASARRLAFSDATLSIDAIDATGAIAMALDGARPTIDARLDVEALDLNPYIGAGGDAAGAQPAQPVASGGGAAGAPAGWSDAPIDAALLNAVDAELALSTNSVIVDAVEIGRSELDIALKAGRMNAVLRQLALYGGVARGRLSLDAAQPALGVELDLTVDGVQAFALLRAAADLDRLEGRAFGTLTAKARGASQKALVENLSGAGDLKFTDGAILGIDIAGVARSLLTAGLAQPTERPKTDFAELTGSYRIRRGVLTNEDLSLLAPLLRVAGAGTVDLPARRMDYCLKPRLVASLQGQGGDRDQAGVRPIAILVSGPWSDLSPSPRLFACDPAEAARLAAQSATQAPIDALKSLIPGGAAEDGDAAAPASPPDAIGGAVDGLRGLLGR